MNRLQALKKQQLFLQLEL